MRESPVLRLIELIGARGETIEFYDPFMPEIVPPRAHATLTGRLSVPWSADLGGRCDAVPIVTDHDRLDYAAIPDRVLVVDARNACRCADMTSPKLVLA